jgi:hypothetical protein
MNLLFGATVWLCKQIEWNISQVHTLMEAPSCVTLVMVWLR